MNTHTDNECVESAASPAPVFDDDQVGPIEGSFFRSPAIDDVELDDHDVEADEESDRALRGFKARRRAAVVAFVLAVAAVVAFPFFYMFPGLRGDLASVFSGDGDLATWVFGGRGQSDANEVVTTVSGSLTPEEDLRGDGSLASARPRVSRFGDLVSAPAPEEVSLTEAPRQVRGGVGANGRSLDERGLDAAGRRSAAEVRSSIQALAPSIQQCYERRMRTNGTLRRVVYVQFAVTPSGMVSGVGLRSASVRDRGLLLCLRSRLSTARLGRGPTERYVVPIRFVPSANAN